MYLVNSILNFLHVRKLKLEETGVTFRVYKPVPQPEEKASSKRYSSNTLNNLKRDLSVWLVCKMWVFVSVSPWQ